MARTDRERELIQRFLWIYNEEKSANYTVTEWPDENSSVRAIDAVARDEILGALAIEHTLVQPFENERRDSAIFIQSLAPLDHKAEILKAGFDVTLTFKVGAVPKGANWTEIPSTVEAWYLSSFDAIPIGNSNHIITGVPFELAVNVDKEGPPTNRTSLSTAGCRRKQLTPS